MVTPAGNTSFSATCTSATPSYLEPFPPPPSSSTTLNNYFLGEISNVFMQSQSLPPLYSHSTHTVLQEHFPWSILFSILVYGSIFSHESSSRSKVVSYVSLYSHIWHNVSTSQAPQSGVEGTPKWILPLQKAEKHHVGIHISKCKEKYNLPFYENAV